MNSFEQLMIRRQAAIAAASAALPAITNFAVENELKVKSFTNGFCIQIELGTHAASISWAKKIEWGPETNAIEIALLDKLDGSLEYIEDAGYFDVCIFEDMDEVKEELLRLVDYFKQDAPQAMKT